jgi:hypothetical protein
LLLCSSYLALGVPNCLAIIIIINYTLAIKSFSGAVTGEEKEDLYKGYSKPHLHRIHFFVPTSDLNASSLDVT